CMLYSPGSGWLPCCRSCCCCRCLRCSTSSRGGWLPLGGGRSDWRDCCWPLHEPNCCWELLPVPLTVHSQHPPHRVRIPLFQPRHRQKFDDLRPDTLSTLA